VLITRHDNQRMNANVTADFEGATALPDWGVIRASGADAASFLQSQLTQDVLGLDAGRSCLAGWCSAKGRLMASFIVWRPAADEVLLACSADVLPAVLKRLSMFVLRAKCKLSDASAELPLFGVAGTAVAVGAWRRVGASIGLPPAHGVARALVVGEAPALPALDAGAWAWLEVASGVPRIVAATVEQFVPQMVNFEVVGGVNFQKGCYPGQEVVARSQYRGTVKRRAFVFESPTKAAPAQEIFHSADREQPAGMVVNAASWQSRHLLLAEIKLATLDGGTLHLGAAEGPQLTRTDMPYSVPLEATA
jgi:tRNA-modifying protein YgfZ